MENRQGNERASHDLTAETPEPGARPGNVSEPIGDSTISETPFEDTWPSIPGAKPTPLHMRQTTSLFPITLLSLVVILLSRNYIFSYVIHCIRTLIVLTRMIKTPIIPIPIHMNPTPHPRPPLLPQTHLTFNKTPVSTLQRQMGSNSLFSIRAIK